MKKVLVFSVRLLVLLYCTVAGFAETYAEKRLSDIFIPEEFTERLNENIDSVVNLCYPELDQNDRNKGIKYLQVKYSEIDGGFLYYNNEDWIVELAAYYKNGNAAISNCANSFTFSFPVENDVAFFYEILVPVVAATACSFDETLDYKQLTEYVDSCYNDYQKTGLRTGEKGYEPLNCNGFDFGVMLYNQNGLNRCAIMLIRDEGNASIAGSAGGGEVTGREYIGSLSDYKKVYFRDAVATSELQEGDILFFADYAINLNLNRPWVEGVKGDGIGQSITMKFQNTETIKILGFQIGYARTQNLYDKNNRPRSVRITFSDGSGFDYIFRDTREEQYIQLSEPVETRLVKVEILDVYPGTECEDTCIYMVRAFQ